jgi:hypothetical protein
VDQSAHIGRRQVDINGPGAENLGSDLRGITTDGFSVADRHPLASASQPRRGFVSSGRRGVQRK